MKSKALKITLWTVVIVLVVLVGISFGGGFYMVNYALEGIPERDMQVEKERVCPKYPLLREWMDSLENAGILRDTSITDDEGFKICAYYAEAEENARKSAVIVHGYKSSPVAMMMIARMFRDSLGYNILVPHLNFHGESEGNSVQMGWKDRYDVEQWLPVAHQMFNDTLQVLHGISMGGATVMMASGDELPEYVRGIVDDCGYSSVWDQFSKELKVQFGLPPFPLLYTADLITKCKYGWGFKEASSVKQLARCTLPVLFIHGDSDDYVPTAHVYLNYDAKVQGEKDLWLVPFTDHANSYMNYPAEYTDRVREFLRDKVE